MIVYPGITEKSLKNVLARVALYRSSVDGFHFDFADGIFVPNVLLSIDDLGDLPNYFFEAHLMVEKPEEYFERCMARGFKRVIVHTEALKEQSDEYILKTQEQVNAMGMEFGLSFKKGSNIPYDILCKLNYVLVMTIVPGFSGQPFLSEQVDMVKDIRAKCENLVIGVDGHVDMETAPILRDAGVNALISTSFLSGDDLTDKYLKLKGIDNVN
jgi:ribulose-phosphate 3-epimerase